MALKRRAFLQQTGVALAALGFSEAGVALFADRYQQALAQPTPRKLALLIGINQYPESVCDFTPMHGSALNGCITDVELQQELLIHRFGFQPSDILVLTDQAATRQGIADAFATLAQLTKAGDLVLFHFSGLGSRVHLEATAAVTASLAPSSAPGSSLQNSLVPIDGTLPTAENPVVNDLLQDSLGLLLRSLPTQQIISVLDVSYTDLGRTAQGNLRIRSRPNAPTGSMAAAELALREQLLHQTHSAPLQQRQGQLPGVVLRASTDNQVALEAQLSGFSCGLFTQALTQQLWWSTPATTLWTSFKQAAGTVKQAAGIEQQPELSGQAQHELSLNAASLPNADGVIRSIDEDGKAQLWLAGLPTAVLENAGASLFTIADAETSLLRLRSRDGLTIRARGLSGEAPQPGQFIQEAVRILPHNISLIVAIDTTLERIERVDATSAFAAIPRVSSVIAGEQSADFLFGKTQSDSLVAALPPQKILAPSLAEASPNPAQNGYGLFYPGRDPIPNTLTQDAAVKTAVNRLTPQLKTLLAIKLLRLTANQGTSRLGVQASLESSGSQVILQQETGRALQSPVSRTDRMLSNQIPLGSQIQYRLYNYSQQPVHFMLIGLDTKGNAIVFDPTEFGADATSQSLIAPGETVLVPQTAASWLIQNPTGLVETYLVFSRTPFVQAAQVLTTERRSKPDAQQVSALLNPLEVVQAVLQDLHQASSSILPDEAPPDTYALDVNAWATLSFVYQVVEA